jgi:hypothetical protein
VWHNKTIIIGTTKAILNSNSDVPYEFKIHEQNAKQLLISLLKEERNITWFTIKFESILPMIQTFQTPLKAGAI